MCAGASSPSPGMGGGSNTPIAINQEPSMCRTDLILVNDLHAFQGRRIHDLYDLCGRNIMFAGESHVVYV